MNNNSTVIFRERSKSCPGDLRISWRLALTLLVLFNSRANKASFAKLHTLNDALRSKASREKLTKIINGELDAVAWRLRVEPAFSRALDFLVGEGLANWSVASNRTTLALTEIGVAAAKEIEACDDALIEERAFLNNQARKITEGFVQSLLAAGKRFL